MKKKKLVQKREKQRKKDNQRMGCRREWKADKGRKKRLYTQREGEREGRRKLRIKNG